MRTRLVWLLVLAASACGDDDVRECTAATECLQGGVHGVCTPSPYSSKSFCAFPDPACASGWRFGLMSGDGLERQCVQPSIPDGAPPDGPMNIDGSPPDGATDAPPAAGWAVAISSGQYDFGRAVAYDPAGNLYFAGAFYGNAIFAGGPITANGQSDIVVAKFSPDGRKLWVRTIGGTGADDVFDLQADGSRVVAVGSFTGTVDFGMGLVTASSTGGTDGYVLALDPLDGATQWIDRQGGTGSTVLRSVDLDAGQIVVGGDFTGTFVLPSGSSQARGVVDLVVLRYALAGSLVWPHVISGTDFDNMGGVALTPDGDVLAAGHYRGTLDSGVTPSMTALGISDVFVAKLDGSSGAPLWARSYGGASTDVATAIDRSDGGIWLGGCFSGSAAFGAINLDSQGMEDGFVALLNQNGDVQWAKRIGSTESDCVSNIVAEGTDAVVAGTFMGTMLIEGASLRSLGDKDIWLAQYTNTGVGLAARRSGGDSADASEGLAVRDGWLAVAGNTRGAPDMFGIPLPPLDLFSDGFAVQLQR